MGMNGLVLKVSDPNLYTLIQGKNVRITKYIKTEVGIKY
jgi:hypothetical protein